MDNQHQTEIGGMTPPPPPTDPFRTNYLHGRELFKKIKKKNTADEVRDDSTTGLTKANSLR